MPDFSTRSFEKELLDNPEVPFDDIRRNMHELNSINTLLGGHAITLKGFRKLLGDKKQVSVCEIGCGGGDNLLVIHEWCESHGVGVNLIGIDINPHCIAFANNQHKDSKMTFVCSDYKEYVFSEKPDIIFNSLFCHHFTNDELREMLLWMYDNSQSGFFINDLHRHSLAYYSIRWLTKLFSKSYLVKKDAPLSVLRGFRKNEWPQLLNNAGIKVSKISWEWAFRHLIVCRK